jgi:hypothetical protein
MFQNLISGSFESQPKLIVWMIASNVGAMYIMVGQVPF